MKTKRGAELAIGTLVIIVLAVIVLVVLVVGFTTGWNNLWGNISAFFGGSNVDTMVKACDVACTTQAKNAFCIETRSVTGITGDKTCQQLATTESAKGFKTCTAIVC